MIDIHSEYDIFILSLKVISMSVQRKTITVTKQQDFWIKSQISSGSYGNDSEYT